MVSVSQYLQGSQAGGQAGPFGIPFGQGPRRLPGFGGLQLDGGLPTKPTREEELEERKRAQLSMLEELFGQLRPLIGRATQGAFQAQTESLGRGRTQALSNAAEEFAAAGGAPSTFASTVKPGIDLGYREQLGALRGQSEADYQGALGNLLTELTSGKLSVENFFEGLMSQEKIAKQTGKSTEKAGLLGAIGGGLGLLAGL